MIPRPAATSGRCSTALCTATVLAAAIVLQFACRQPEAAPPEEWVVKAGADGNGTASSPFGSIQAALRVARAGDVVAVEPGIYHESLRTVRGGTASERIVLRARQGAGTVTVTAPGRVLTLSHPFVTVDGLILDGDFGLNDLVRIESDASGTVLRNCEIRRTSRDGIDMGAPHDVVIENCHIHHMLDAEGGRTDAHGITGGPVRRLTIRDTEIDTFSGDGVQFDPGRDAPGWDDVVIERCRIWLAPLTADTNGFRAGTVTGENAVDTKARPSLPRAHLTIRDTEAWGYKNGLISNMAAFNIKENVDVVIDGVTVHDSEIAFRLRGSPREGGGARVRLQNAVVYDVGAAFRYEDNIENLRIWNATVGSGVERAFVNALSPNSVLDVRNLLVLGPRLPREAQDASNLAVDARAFVDAAKHDYHLAARSPAIDHGTPIADVSTDRAGTPRPQGKGMDPGAYERAAGGGGASRR